MPRQTYLVFYYDRDDDRVRHMAIDADSEEQAEAIAAERSEQSEPPPDVTGFSAFDAADLAALASAIRRITYNAPDYENKTPSNEQDVVSFVGPQPPCPVCNDRGEYETGYGPAGCPECLSRLIPFMDYRGVRVTADWGDTIVREDDGLHLVRKTES